jgi:hypothetical protein
MMRLMRLPNDARYPEASMTREEGHLLIRLGGLGYEQTMDVPLKYVNAEDEETAELMLLAQLQQVGYRARRDAS